MQGLALTGITMKTLSPFKLALTSVISCTLSFNALANTEPQSSDGLSPGDSDSKWVVGVMGFTSDNIYKDGHDINFLSPILEYRGDVMFLKDGELGAKLLSSGKTQQGEFSGGLLLTAQDSYLSDDDLYKNDAALAGLKEREGVAEAGVYLRHKSELGQAKLKFFGDMQSEKYGNRAEVQYIFDINFKQWQINPMVTAIWEDSDRVNHFYGVSESEATQTRAQYKGKSNVHLAASINSRYRVNKIWDIEMSVAYVHLGDGVTDSSIVSKDDITMVAFGTKYNF